MPSLWLGNERDAVNCRLLRQRIGVHVVVSVEEFPTNLGRRGGGCQGDQIERIHFSMLDSQKQADDPNFVNLLITIVAVIKEKLDQGKTVLIHCSAGKSRSVVCTCAFLILEHRHTVKSALKLIAAVRPIIDPHPALLKRLHELAKRAKMPRTQMNQCVVIDSPSAARLISFRYADSIDPATR